jgi:hypothetical protein
MEGWTGPVEQAERPNRIPITKQMVRTFMAGYGFLENSDIVIMDPTSTLTLSAVNI